MPEMPHPGEHHREFCLVRSVDNFLIAHRPAWLDDRGRASLCCGQQAVSEGEERI